MGIVYTRNARRGRTGRRYWVDAHRRGYKPELGTRTYHRFAWTVWPMVAFWLLLGWHVEVEDTRV